MGGRKALMVQYPSGSGYGKMILMLLQRTALLHVVLLMRRVRNNTTEMILGK